MSVAEHLAHASGQGSDTTMMNISLHDQAHYNAQHAGTQGQQASTMSLPLDAQTNQGGQATHHDGMSVAEHLAHPAGQGSDTSAMNISLHDQAHYHATNAMAHETNDAGHSHA
jgi:hypothetical protein